MTIINEEYNFIYRTVDLGDRGGVIKLINGFDELWS